MISWHHIALRFTETGTATGHSCCAEGCLTVATWNRQHVRSGYLVSFYYCNLHARENGLPEPEEDPNGRPSEP